MQPTLDYSNTRIGRYELKRLLGVGGTSKVYLAIDTELHRQVAVKCIDINVDDQSVTQSIEREAALTAQLNHQNIVQLYDVVKTETVLGLVMEYVDGVTLSDKLGQSKPTTEQALEWSIQVAQGLCHAHQSGIVHCDLKPDNIIVTNHNILKIADFGIAKLQLPTTSLDVDTAAAISGSYHAVSPEQAQGQKIDFRSDVFSFGLLLYQLLTGRHPFGSSENSQTIMHRIVHQRFEFNALDRVEMSNELMELISALLEKKAQNRPTNMDKVTTTLQQILHSQNSSFDTEDHTRVLTPITPQASWQKSRGIWFAAAALISIIGAATLALLAWQWWPEKAVPSLYVAVLEPVIETQGEFDEEFKRQITTTLKTSMQEGVINLEHVNLIVQNDLESFDNNYQNFADAMAADVILRIEASCSRSQCQLNLQRLSGPQWIVQTQKNWPAIATSLSDIRHTTLSELYQLFDGEQVSGESQNVDEAAYREYLDIYKESGAGVDATAEHLRQLERIYRDLDFFPLYELYVTAALDLYKESNESVYLKDASNFLQRASLSTRARPEFKSLEFDLLLLRGQVAEAQEIIDQLTTSGAERLLVNELRADLAAHNNDYESAVLFERENAQLRPTLSRLYNLAASEFYLGNFELASRSANLALNINPEDTDTHNLLGAIALTQGNLEQAISSYLALVSKIPNGDNLSNLGLSLMLKRDYKRAIEYQQRALSLNPTSPSALLNLADSYNLQGDLATAKSIYQQVLAATDNKSNVMQYTGRAQAQAHLGLHIEAIRTLQDAKKQYSDSPDLSYSSAIVHSIAGNYGAAIVETEDAISQGMGTIWFSMKWFEKLCSYPRFTALFDTDSTPQVCVQLRDTAVN
ncbi:serine/threonine-protein kinase [Arenicella xantha]|uniref:non-specific serine/threonine protein kinase n=1 Tax=Arenicella xantha TaxID=644221 RepID=A0A395JTI5_9GAMM|nr:serine/threonine-protein kinase [Arenicella xantha]RBP52888.1 serine/threonine-protein kinase [Arenicella xantha]